MKKLLAILIGIAVSLPLVIPAGAFGATEEKGWNFNKSTINGVSTAEFHQKWVNYEAVDGWKSLDTKFTATAEGFVMTGAPFEFTAPLRADGVAIFHNNNRYNNITHSEIREAPLDMTIQAQGILPVSGIQAIGDLRTESGLAKSVRYIVYPGAYPSGADLIYYVHEGIAPRLQKLVRFNSAGQFFASASFAITYSSDPTFEIGKAKTDWDKKGELSTSSPIMVKTTENRGIGLRNFQIWDSNPIKEKIAPIDVSIDKTAEGYLLTKHIPLPFFSDAVFPVYTDTTTSFFPDPNVEVTTADGIALHISDNTAFATIRGGAGTNADDSSASSDFVVMETGTVSNYRKIHRFFADFDTSSIGAGSTVSAATISFVSTATSNTNSATAAQAAVHAANAAPASNTAIISTDYATAGNTSFGSIAFASIDTGGSNYNDITLDATGQSNVNKVSISYFSLRFGGDINNSAPTVNGASLTTTVTANQADTAGTTTDPKLTVTYSGAGGASSTDTSSINALFFLF